MERGDVLVIRTPGGEGYVDPPLRDPRLVLRNILDEKVSIESAARDYGAIINPKDMSIDGEATKKLRGRLKKD